MFCWSESAGCGDFLAVQGLGFRVQEDSKSSFKTANICSCGDSPLDSELFQ